MEEATRHNVKLDSLGRVCIPKSFLRGLGWEEDSNVSLAIVDGKVIVSKDNVLTDCPKCGTEVHIKDNFCSFCGEKLHE